MDKIDEKEVIDFGKWTTPKSWDELTLKQFQAIEKYYADKDKEFDARDVLEVFTEHSRDEIDQLPIEFSERLLEGLKWLSEQPQWGETTNKVEIDGETYIVNVQNKLKTGEYIAADMALKGDKYNYAALLAILCRKEDEIYDSKFENEVLEDRIKMWENVSVTKVMPIVSFFLGLWVISQKDSQLYSALEEALDLTAESIKSSDRIGAFKRHSMMSQIKTLRKSLESTRRT